MLSHLVIVLALVAGSSAAEARTAIECRAAKGAGNAYWAWRIVEGRRCWYVGRRGKDKRLLTWAKAAPVIMDEPRPAPIAAPPVPVQWLDMPRALAPTFEQRWQCATRGQCR